MRSLPLPVRAFTRELGLSIASVLSPASAVLILASLVTAQQREPTLPVFVEGQAQIVEGFKDPEQWIRHDLWVETEFDSDGDGRLDRMHMDVTRPAQTKSEGLRVPVIYETSPYYSGTGSTQEQFMWNPRQELGDFPAYRESSPPIPFQKPRSVISDTHVGDWVPRGFAVVHSESPGTGQSQGCPTAGGANESLAPKAVIDWLGGRARGFTSLDGEDEVVADWCTGKVGMTGTSYNGTLCIAAATTGVEGLAAIIPVAPNTSYYRYYRSNGLVRHPGGYMGEDIDVLYDFVHSGSPDVRDYCNETVRDQVLLEGIDRLSGDYNDFWDGREYANYLDPYRTPTLMSHAFNDWNVMPEHSVLFYETLKQKGVPVQAFFHQGGHGGPPPLDQMNRWFTRYVYGIENDVESDPRAWIVREGAKNSEPTPYADYPNPDALEVTFHLSTGGAGTGGLSPTRAGDQGTETLVDDVSKRGSELAAAEESKHRLLYATPPLTEALHISGTSHITVRLASNEPAVNLSVWVVSLPWTKTSDINANIITRGWADPQNHASLTEGEPLEPGEFYDVSFDLQPDDQIIPVGQRIGLMIFASDRDFTLWPEPGTELTIDLDGTAITMPLVGGAAH